MTERDPARLHVRAGPWPRVETISVPLSAGPPVTIGVAVPLHDNADVLEATVDALLENLGPGDRIALVENGSRDGTHELAVRRYGAEPRIVIDRLTAGDAAVARNRAIELLGSVDFVAFCDGDDRWLPGRLGRVRAALAATRADVLFQPLIARTPLGAEVEGATFRTKSLPRGATLLEDLLVAGNFFSTSGLVLRRALLPLPLFADGLRRTQDYEAWCRFAAHHPHATVCYLDEPAADYRRGVAGLSADRWQRAANVFRIRRSYRQRLGMSARIQLWGKRHLWLWAWSLRTGGNPLRALRVVLSHDDPRLFRGGR